MKTATDICDELIQVIVPAGDGKDYCVSKAAEEMIGIAEAWEKEIRADQNKLTRKDCAFDVDSLYFSVNNRAIDRHTIKDVILCKRAI